jgi:hypothetical protein
MTYTRSWPCPFGGALSLLYPLFVRHISGTFDIRQFSQAHCMLVCCESVRADYSLRWQISRTRVVIRFRSQFCLVLRLNPALGHTRLP